MPPVIMTEGADYYARLCLGIIQADKHLVSLYVNLHTIIPDDEIGLYTECTWPGYSPFTLTPGEWDGGADDGVAVYGYPLITFNFDPSGIVQQSIYGYFVHTLGGLLLYVEQFAAPFPIPPEGGSIPLSLFWTDEQCVD